MTPFHTFLAKPSTTRLLDRMLAEDRILSRPCLHLGSGCGERMVLVETSPAGIQWFRCPKNHDSFVQPERYAPVSVAEVVERH